MTIEEKLKQLILDEYKSIRAFTKEINVPYSTIDTMFKRGIGGTSVTTVMKMCKALNIDTDALIDNEIKKRKESVKINITLPEEKHLNKYRELDEHGKDIVNTVLDMEHIRCKNEISATKEDKDYLIPCAAHNKEGAEGNIQHDIDLMKDDELWK